MDRALSPGAADPVCEIRAAKFKADDVRAALPPRGKSILLADDININREVISESLRSLGCKVALASNGAEALEMVRLAADAGSGWDLILMDVRMPVMDGLASTRAIRALGDRAASTPIVALSGALFAAEIQQCREAGMNDHIAKPVSLAALVKALHHWTGEAVYAGSQPASDQSSLAGRFDMRCRSSAQRLEELAQEIRERDGESARPLLREAQDLAHALAGTAGMFEQAELGTLASEVEQEIVQIGRAQGPLDEEKAATLLVRLTDALMRGPPAREPEAHDRSAIPRPARPASRRPGGDDHCLIERRASERSASSIRRGQPHPSLQHNE